MPSTGLPPGVASLVPVIMILLNFGLGASLTVADFRQALEHWRGPLVAVLCQFGIMPVTALLLALLFGATDLQGLSMILMGCCPGGAISNLFAYYSKSELPLSILTTAFSTLLATFVMPELVWIYSRPFAGVDTEIRLQAVLGPLAIVAVAVVSGMVVKHFSDHWARRAERVSSAFGMIFIGITVAVGVATQYQTFFESGHMLAAASVLMPLGGALGYSVARLAGLPPKAARAICFETGIQNGPVCLAVLVYAFPAEQFEEVSTFPLLYLFFTNIDGVLMVLFFRFVLPDSVSGESISSEGPSKELSPMSV